SRRCQALLAACGEAGIAATLCDDIQRSIWMKFVMLAPMSGLTALTRGPIGPLRSDPDSRKLLEAAVRETVAVGMAQGVSLKPADAEAVIAAIDALPAAMMASMCHDLLAGKPLEIAVSSGAVLRPGQRTGWPLPTPTFL